MSHSANPDYDRAMERLREHDAEGALPSFDAAVRVEPERARIHANRALALAHVDRLPDAITAIAAGVTLAPDDAYVAVCAAHIARCDQRWDDALEEARRALELEPHGSVRAWACREVGWSLIELGRVRDALDLAGDLVAADPFDAEAQSLRADALAACGRWGEALRVMDGALATGADDPAMQARRDGFAEVVDGLAPEIARAWAATGERPSDWEAWHALGVLLVQVGEVDEAREAFASARAVHPDAALRDDPTRALSAWEEDCRAAVAAAP